MRSVVIFLPVEELGTLLLLYQWPQTDGELLPRVRDLVSRNGAKCLPFLAGSPAGSPGFQSFLLKLVLPVVVNNSIWLLRSKLCFS